VIVYMPFPEAGQPAGVPIMISIDGSQTIPHIIPLENMDAFECDKTDNKMLAIARGCPRKSCLMACIAIVLCLYRY